MVSTSIVVSASLDSEGTIVPSTMKAKADTRKKRSLKSILFHPPAVGIFAGVDPTGSPSSSSKGANAVTDDDSNFSVYSESSAMQEEEDRIGIRAEQAARRKGLHGLPDRLKPGKKKAKSEEPGVALGGEKERLSIPLDIVRGIVDHLDVSEMLSLSLTSKRMYAFMAPSLYHTITLSSSRACSRTLRMFLKKPHLAQLVRKMVLRPNYYLAWPREDKRIDEGRVEDMVIRLAMSGDGDALAGLETFDWDGLEMPNSVLWTTLRLRCPRLKNVFTNLGRIPIDPDSSLFDFRDLKSFSMIVRHGLGGTEPFPTPTLLPRSLWTMLLHHCPNLQELTLCSFSASFKVLDFERAITEGRWKNLQTLTLGGFGYERDFGIGPRSVLGSEGNASSPLGTFINAHPGLECVRFLWNFNRWMSPEDVPVHLTNVNAESKDLSQPGDISLPAFETFSGIYQQLSSLPTSHPMFSSIHTLDLTCEPIYESRASALAGVLSRLPNLKSLDLWVHLHFDESRVRRVLRGVGWKRRERDYTGFYECIFSALGGLEECHWMVTTAFGVAPLNQLLSRLHLMPRLKRFSLTKGYSYWDDESMLKSAVRILTYGWLNGRVSRSVKVDGEQGVQEGHIHGLPELPAGLGPASTSILVPPRGVSTSSMPPIDGHDDADADSLGAKPDTGTNVCVSVSAYPKLYQINIRWAKEKCTNHLKQDGTYDVVYPLHVLPADSVSDGESRCGDRPIALDVVERGIPAVGRPFSRQYRHVVEWDSDE
ncbi:hypothetical protein D9613_012248 [Agrocybe pediades]|uniref:F-box domain-containing protein n=1 Tax=Agrocybe pediades TaxID=84607 RepID=A0A8H4QFM5_9AGAR|nr:hypothetical protein D9613_012248 [Agrocybe pediades]